ncbi:MAG: protein-disulfide reductase DsbD [Parasulfuritortus sp.]|nr:protein-disulfide reductase DsbD [Parasulfuritortus sp.]
MIRFFLFSLLILASPILKAAESDLLEPEQAFRYTAHMVDAKTIEAQFRVADGYYLYRDKIKFAADTVKLGKPDFPPGKIKQDDIVGREEIYPGDFKVRIPVDAAKTGQHFTLTANYQGCAGQFGICFPPIETKLQLDVPAAAKAAATQAKPEPTKQTESPLKLEPIQSTPSPVTVATAPQATEPPPVQDTSDSGKITRLLKGGNFWLIIAGFFGAGLLLSLTPCVFPMIPILSGIIVGQGHRVTKGRGFMLSLAYVLGMAITYALAGVAAGMSGTLISNALQNPWALGTGAAIFVALAFSMFGFYELQLPSFLQSRFTEASNKQQGGKLTGVFIMGALSALIVGPCVAAPLAGALLYIGQSGDVVLGGIALFSLALGMGVPLLLVGLSAGALLPRAGGWMEAVKKFFGVLLLGVAVWLISPLIPDLMQMLVWAALLIISGVYLRAMDPLASDAGGWHRFWKGIGIITLVAGVSLLLGALGGSRDPLQPLSIFKGGTAAAAQAEPKLIFQRIKSVAELDAAVKAAAGRPAMLDFYADWCVSCKEFEHNTFSDPRVQARLKDVTLLQVDVTGNTDDDKALLKRFSLFGPPGIIFFDKSGKEQASSRVVGYEPPEKFLGSLSKALP